MPTSLPKHLLAIILITISAQAQSGNPMDQHPWMNTTLTPDERVRMFAAVKEAVIPVPPHTTNGDEERYSDKSGTYSKGLLQDGIGLVNLAAYRSLRRAINTGRFEDWENIITGGTRTENGPMGSYAFTLEGTDNGQFGDATSPANQILQIVVAPAPALASETYGTELIEMYWASLLRDVAFTDYATNAQPVPVQGAYPQGMPERHRPTMVATAP